MWMQTGGDQPSKGLAGSSKGVDANTQSRTARQLTGKEFPDDERIQKGKTTKKGGSKTKGRQSGKGRKAKGSVMG